MATGRPSNYLDNPIIAYLVFPALLPLKDSLSKECVRLRENALKEKSKDTFEDRQKALSKFLNDFLKEFLDFSISAMQKAPNLPEENVIEATGKVLASQKKLSDYISNIRLLTIPLQSTVHHPKAAYHFYSLAVLGICAFRAHFMTHTTSTLLSSISGAVPDHMYSLNSRNNHLRQINKLFLVLKIISVAACAIQTLIDTASTKKEYCPSLRQWSHWTSEKVLNFFSYLQDFVVAAEEVFFFRSRNFTCKLITFYDVHKMLSNFRLLVK